MENNKLSEMMQSTMSNIKNLVEVNNIVGEPIVTPDGLTIIPVSRLSFGYGGGSAAGVKIEPIGFLVVKEGSVRMINVAPPAKTSVDRMLDLVPDVMDKIESISTKNKE